MNVKWILGDKSGHNKILCWKVSNKSIYFVLSRGLFKCTMHKYKVNYIKVRLNIVNTMDEISHLSHCVDNMQSDLNIDDLIYWSGGTKFACKRGLSQTEIDCKFGPPKHSFINNISKTSSSLLFGTR